MLNSFIKDIRLSVLNSEELKLKEYKRISSRLTPFYKYLEPVISVIIIMFFIKVLVLNPHKSIIYLPFTVILFHFIIVIRRCMLCKNTFLSQDGPRLLIINPYKNKIDIIEKNKIPEVRGTSFIRMDIITVRVSSQNKVKSFYFIGKYRFVKFWDLHPIVKELNHLFQTYKR